jgi:succinyl-CoA synthetase beta subunit
MNFTEHAGKAVLRAAGIPTPDGVVARTPEDVADAARRIGRCVIKAQVPTGKRGKAGGIRLAAAPEEAADHARAILGMTIGEHQVDHVLVDPQVNIAREMYAAVLSDPETQGPLLLFSPEGGMDIEEIAAEHPDALLRLRVNILKGIDETALAAAVRRYDPPAASAITDILVKLYEAYRASDAELIEINPLVQMRDGHFVALDCKLTVDDSALARQEELARAGSPDKTTDLEARAKALHLKYIELDGEVGVLANGAGLTMTTMDAIRHFGGEPANFMEIGGDSYTKAVPALEIVLANPNVKALLVNFCGAFARTDVMAEGVINAWLELKPKVPIVFTIHGTGEDEAIAMVRDRLGIEPYDFMDDAVKAAVAAAKGARA